MRSVTLLTLLLITMALVLWKRKSTTLTLHCLSSNMLMKNQEKQLDTSLSTLREWQIIEKIKLKLWLLSEGDSQRPRLCGGGQRKNSEGLQAYRNRSSASGLRLMKSMPPWVTAETRGLPPYFYSCIYLLFRCVRKPVARVLRNWPLLFSL